MCAQGGIVGYGLAIGSLSLARTSSRSDGDDAGGNQCGRKNGEIDGFPRSGRDMTEAPFVNFDIESTLEIVAREALANVSVEVGFSDQDNQDFCLEKGPKIEIAISSEESTTTTRTTLVTAESLLTNITTPQPQTAIVEALQVLLVCD